MSQYIDCTCYGWSATVDTEDFRKFYGEMTKLIFSQNLTNSHFLSSESINYISDKLIVGSQVKGQGEWTGKGALRQLKRGGVVYNGSRRSYPNEDRN